MESVFIKLIETGSREAILLLGWVLYLHERYFVSPKREKEFRDELTAFRHTYQQVVDKVSATISGFHPILEVIKDRIGRN